MIRLRNLCGQQEFKLLPCIEGSISIRTAHYSENNIQKQRDVVSLNDRYTVVRDSTSTTIPYIL